MLGHLRIGRIYLRFIETSIVYATFKIVRDKDPRDAIEILEGMDVRADPVG
jgi:hypothetical protein